MHRSVQTLLLGAVLAAGAPASAEDIWGPGNDLSDVQGGVAHAPVRADLALVPSAENRSLCDGHFANMERANQREIERLSAMGLQGENFRNRYRDYIDERDGFSRRCAATFRGAYDRALDATLAHGRYSFPIEAFRQMPPGERPSPGTDPECRYGINCYDLTGRTNAAAAAEARRKALRERLSTRTRERRE